MSPTTRLFAPINCINPASKNRTIITSIIIIVISPEVKIGTTLSHAAIPHPYAGGNA